MLFVFSKGSTLFAALFFLFVSCSGSQSGSPVDAEAIHGRQTDKPVALAFSVSIVEGIAKVEIEGKNFPEKAKVDIKLEPCTGVVVESSARLTCVLSTVFEFEVTDIQITSADDPGAKVVALQETEGSAFPMENPPGLSIFVSSTKLNGILQPVGDAPPGISANVTAIARAEAVCQAEGEMLYGSGTHWEPVISTDQLHAISRISRHGTVSNTRAAELGGPEVFAENILSFWSVGVITAGGPSATISSYSAPNYYWNGTIANTQVWTGTTTEGMLAPNCLNWSDYSPLHKGNIGRSAGRDLWVSFGDGLCSSARSIYCVEQ